MPHVQASPRREDVFTKNRNKMVKVLQRSSFEQGNYLNKLLKMRSAPQMSKTTRKFRPLGYMCGTWGLQRWIDHLKIAPTLMC
jgi:hypothetical protein